MLCILFVLPYIHIQGSLEAMNLHAQTLLCGTGNNFCSYMHFLNQWVTHTQNYWTPKQDKFDGKLQKDTGVNKCYNPIVYIKIVTAYYSEKKCCFSCKYFSNSEELSSLSVCTYTKNKYKHRGSHIISIFQLYNTFRKSNVWQYKI